MDQQTPAGTALSTGREAFRCHAWSEAHAQLTTADRASPLEPKDLERLGMARSRATALEAA